MPIFVGLPLAVAGFIAAYFVSRDTLNFTLVQTAIALIMLMVFCALIIYGRRIWDVVRSLFGSRSKS